MIPVHNQREHNEPLGHFRQGETAQARIVAERHVLGAGKALADWLRTREGA